MPYPRAASQRRENVRVEFPDSHEPYFGSGSFSRPEAGLTNLERWPIFFSRSVACSGSTEIIGQFLETVSALLHNHLPRLAFEFSLTTSAFTYFTCSSSQIVTYLWKHQVNLQNSSLTSFKLFGIFTIFEMSDCNKFIFISNICVFQKYSL